MTVVSLLVHADAAVLAGKIVSGATVRIEDGVVSAAGDRSAPADRTVRARGTLLPGPIDLQVNGAGGHGVDEAEPQALDAIAAQVAGGGACAFLPTLITAPFERLLEQTARVAAWIDSRTATGATPLGIHLEGPFLEVAGAHDASCFVDPTAQRVDALIEAARGQLRLVTLAPGRKGAPEAVARLRAAGVAVALGRARDVGQLGACVDAGAALVTHLFNAMGPLHHRDPGLAGRALDEPRLTCSLIVDGAHVHPVMVRNARRCLGAERTVLVTDSVSAAGMPDGEYHLSGSPVRLGDGVVRDREGRLAGSALTMARAAENYLGTVPDADAAELARVTSTNPARILGLEDRGAIVPGAVAELAVLSPERQLARLEL